MKTKLFTTFLFLITSLLFLSGCASTEKLLEEKSVIGMSKSDLLDYTLFAPDGDSPLVFCENEYFEDINYEISWGFSESYFYVFKNVTKPNNCASYLASLFDTDANGRVIAYFRDYKSAKEYVNNYKIKLAEEENKRKLRIEKLKKIDKERKKKAVDIKTYKENQRVYVSKEDKYKRYAKCYGEMTTAHKARGMHKSTKLRMMSIEVKETICKAYSEGEELNYEGKR